MSEAGAPEDRDDEATAAPSGDTSTSPPSRVEERGSIGRGLRAMAMVLLVLIGSCLGGTVVRWLFELFSPAPPPPAEVIEVQPTPDVITAVRDLARLETASFHVERVVDLESRQRRLFGLVEASDSILLVAAADVVAGVDLAQMEDGDVVIEDGRRAIVTLPPVEVFSARLDNDRTYVHTRETDTLAQRRENLETRARQEAERTLREAAIEGGIEERAERNARSTIEALVRAMGFEEVEVRFRDGEG